MSESCKKKRSVGLICAFQRGSPLRKAQKHQAQRELNRQKGTAQLQSAGSGVCGMGGKAYDFLMAVRAFPKFLARALPKSESSKTLIESAANKRGLSKTLDGTLKEGAHDMRVFGLGFLRSLATKDDYGLLRCIWWRVVEYFECVGR